MKLFYHGKIAPINYNRTLGVRKNKKECTSPRENRFGGRGEGRWKQGCRVGQS